MTDEPQTDAAAPVVDGTAEELPPEPLEQPAATGMALAVPEFTGAVIRADDPEEILAKAHQIAKPLAELIERAGLAVDVGGRRKHVEVGGWQACGTLLGALGGQPLHAETVWTRPAKDPIGQPIRHAYTVNVKRYHSKKQGGGLREEVTYEVDGFDWEARVEIRTPAAVVVGVSEAMCSRAEESWNRSADYAVRSMAETRAESRAWRKSIGWVVHLAGYNPTPAEEMGHRPGEDPVDSGPPHGPAAPKNLTDAASAALLALCGGDQQTALARWSQIKQRYGYMPTAAAVALCVAAGPQAVPNQPSPEAS